MKAFVLRTAEGDFVMKVLHILNDGPTELSDEIIRVQSAEYEVRVIDLSKNEMSYGEIVDAIFSCDRVTSW
jgi:hypothetical protein